MPVDNLAVRVLAELHAAKDAALKYRQTSGVRAMEFLPWT
jgi:hypothetical protein